MIRFFNVPVELETIVNYLKKESQLKEVCQNIVYRQIIDRAAQERGITVTPPEIQAEADRQRYERRLESAAATYSWLNEQLITPEDWEAGIRDRLLSRKLAEALFADQVERYFAEHRLDFEQVSLYRITVPYQQLSQELLYQIEESEISFYEAAHLYDIHEQRRLQCGYDGRSYRWSLNPEIAAMVFGARIREVMGPIKSEQGYDLLMVEELISAELSPQIRQDIIDRMFQDWLDSELNYLIHR